MDQLNYKKIITFFLVLCITTVAWAANPKEKYEKIIDREFAISQKGTVHLENKYGNIDIVTSDCDEVKMTVKIIVNARTKDKADEIFDRIDIEFNASRDLVSAITAIGESDGGSWFNWGSEVKGDFQIHYNVEMPETNSLVLKNKYGNTYVDNIYGSADMEVKYGNLKMDEVGQELSLMLGYGNANIGTTKMVSMEVKYATIELGNTGDVNAVTKYSKITFNDAADLSLTTKYDNYDIGTIKSFRNEGKYDHFHIKEAEHIDANSKYTDYKVQYLHDVAEFDLEYGGATIYKVGRQFSMIDLEGRYTDYKIMVEKGANYELELEGDYAGIRYPSAMQVVNHSEDGHEKEVRGYIGSQKKGSTIKADLAYGSIKIEEY